ncbi:MAG: PaaI family thioesterase [Alphaproteobacteria bacterium]|jgi:uncharacterized protein (TIGR00369 family)|nr:PaaI family thioesterase [Alphaproteobacteria bacterium]
MNDSLPPGFINHGADPGSNFARGLGFTVIGREPGSATIAVEVTDRLTHAGGSGHGGLVAALLDVTLSTAAAVPRTADQRPDLFSVTLSLTTSFIAPAPRGRLVCEGWQTGGGRKTIFCEGRVTGTGDTLVATAQGVFRLVPWPEGGG